jgi:hypothetical protein
VEKEEERGYILSHPSYSPEAQRRTLDYCWTDVNGTAQLLEKFMSAGVFMNTFELQLAHAPRNAVSAAYNHALYLEPRQKMMQEWADFLEQLQRGAKVLPFRGDVA